MRLFRSFLFGLLSLIVSPFVAVAMAIERVVLRVVDSPQLALDLSGLRIEPAASPGRSRFVAFVTRALRHADYVAGRFDPGRAIA